MRGAAFDTMQPHTRLRTIRDPIPIEPESSPVHLRVDESARRQEEAKPARKKRRRKRRGTWMRRLRSLSRPQRVLVVGEGLWRDATCIALEERALTVVGVVESTQDTSAGGTPFERTPADYPVLGAMDGILSVVVEHPVDEVYLVGPGDETVERLAELGRKLARCGIPFAIPLNMLPVRYATPALPRTSDGFLHYHIGPAQPVQGWLKRLLDLVASGLGLLALLPLFLVAAAAIKLTSKGPVLFVQERVGRHGMTFPLWKLRTMYEDAEERKRELLEQNERDGPTFKIKSDPRITPVGRLLRKTNIDELPQLVNVLAGDMSLVGPRPPLPDEVAEYEAWQRRRLAVRPGITCYWQVDDRDHISFEEWMTLDLKYVDEWSFKKDIELLLKTIPVVLTGRGSV